MSASTILDRLNSLGIAVTLSGDRLRLEPGSKVPVDVVEELRQHKAEVLSLLMSQRYRPKYPEGQHRDKELAEIVTRVHKEGFVLLWSKVLEDFVAFYRDEETRGTIPPGFVPYKDVELWELFGADKPPLSQDKLRLIHEAKRLGGCVSSIGEVTQ